MSTAIKEEPKKNRQKKSYSELENNKIKKFENVNESLIRLLSITTLEGA